MKKMRASIGFACFRSKGQVRQVLLCFQVLVICFTPAVVRAQGEITGIRVSALPATAGQPVTIQVQGRGRCPVTLYLDHATNGIPYVDLTDGDLPKYIDHVYPRPGTYRLNAQAQHGYTKICPGNVVFKLPVVASTGAGGGARGSGTCKQGFVWREARISDHVCVSPSTRARTRSENYAGGRTTVPGRDVCKQGYVWREAFPTDHVCVTPQSRAEAADDNRHAAERRMD